MCFRVFQNLKNDLFHMRNVLVYIINPFWSLKGRVTSLFCIYECGLTVKEPLL